MTSPAAAERAQLRRSHAFSRTDQSRVGVWWWTVDHWLLGATLSLIGLGVLLSFGSSPAAAARLDIGFPFHFAVRQSIYAVIGLGVLLAVSMLSPRGVRRAAFFIYLVAIAAMPPSAMTQLIGTPAIQNAAPNAMVISTVWPTSGSTSSSATAAA